MKEIEVTCYNLIRSVTEFDASKGTPTVYFDILEASTSKERMINSMMDKVRYIENFPAVRECCVSRTSEDECSVTTNDCPGNHFTEIITAFRVVAMPVTVETHSPAANAIMWANEEAYRAEDVEDAMYEAFNNWDENLSDEEMEAMEKYKQNVVARYSENLSNDNSWRFLMEEAMKAEFDNPEYAAAAKILQEIANNM